MRRNQHLETKYLGALWAAFLLVGLMGCGVEVGNPSEPTQVPPKDQAPGQGAVVPGTTVPIDSVYPVEPVEPVKIDVRYLVENQYDEAITASLDFAFDSTSAGLALADTRTCGALPDGSLILSHQETNSGTRSSGSDGNKTLVTETFNRMFGKTLAAEGKTLACNTELTKPRLDWSNLNTLKVEGTVDRNNTRKIVTDPGQAFVRESSVKATGTQSATLTKSRYDSQNRVLYLERTQTFGTDMQIMNTTASATPVQFNTRVETRQDGPLKVEESYNSDNSLRSLKIVSGIVSSTKQDDGLVVIMKYDNVVLDASGTCKPKEGTILGEVYLPTDPTTIYEKFSIAFTERSNLIVYSDGSGSKLEFEPCRIETQQTNTSGDNDGGYDRGGNRSSGR